MTRHLRPSAADPITEALDARRADAFDSAGGEDDLEGLLTSVISQAASPLADSARRTMCSFDGSEWEPLRDLDAVGPRAIWTDLRPSEAVRLMTYAQAAVDRAIAA